MTEQRQYDGGAGTAHSSPVQQPGRSETPADPSSSAGPEAVAGPFTLRETVIGVSVLVMFTGTILPFVDGVNLWRAFPLFFLGIGILLPVAALALLIGRRSGARHLRVGSLSVDQFASVTAAFAAAFFFLQTVTTFGIGSFIALLGAVGFLVATVGGSAPRGIQERFHRTALVLRAPDRTGGTSGPAAPTQSRHRREGRRLEELPAWIEGRAGVGRPQQHRPQCGLRRCGLRGRPGRGQPAGAVLGGTGQR